MHKRKISLKVLHFVDAKHSFSGVQRSTNAYVPPGARKPGQVPPSSTQSKTNAAVAPLATAFSAVAIAATPSPAPPPHGKESQVSQAAAVPVLTQPTTTQQPSDRSVNLPQARKVSLFFLVGHADWESHLTSSSLSLD